MAHHEPKSIPASNLRATVRIDAAPGGKKFQGVWLELANGDRWVIDYRPRELWRGFEGAEVEVTGYCYRPWGQAINATHFEVDRLKFVTTPKTVVPYFEVGPLRLLRGDFIRHTAPPGSKLAGSSELFFHDDAGASYQIAGSADPYPSAGAAAIQARSVELNLAYAATTGGPHLWILSVHSADYEPDAKTAPARIACP